MVSPPEIHVEVVYALPERAVVRAVALPTGSCVRDALQQSGIDAEAGIHAESLPVGIFSEPATLDTPLNDGDRVELYRPLITDPKLARRGRAKTARR
jgi:hypothetical protein